MIKNKKISICLSMLLIVILLGAFLLNGDTKIRVRFISDNNLVVVQRVEKGKFATLPEEPTKEGYTFKGWSLSENGEILDLSVYKITRDKTFYAVFVKNGENENPVQPVEPDPTPEEPSINLVDCSGVYSKISSDDASNNAPKVAGITLEDIENYNEKVKEIILNVNDINNANQYTLSEQYTKLMNAENSDLDAFDFINSYSKCSGTFSSKKQNITLDCEVLKSLGITKFLLVVIDTKTGKMTCKEFSDYDDKNGTVTLTFENGWTENTIFAICSIIKNEETWVLNETLSSDSNIVVSVNFESNGEKFSGISILRRGTSVEYDGSQVYSSDLSDGWLDDAYRTITFSESVTDETLLTWLEANGTKQ